MRVILPILVLAQFLCTSLWFAGNAVVADMTKELGLEPAFLGHMTSAIQLGFISGTLLFAIFAISDRFSPSRVFFLSAVVAAVFNLGILIQPLASGEILLFRFLTGFFLAGIYPVGMKIASDYYQSGLGKSLGFLVGALVLGTAFPHFLKNFTAGLPWKYVMYSTSSLSALGGLVVLLFIPTGPFYKKGTNRNFSAFLSGFRKLEFRKVSFGYFGHMWELYAFWTFVPVMITSYLRQHPDSKLNVSLLSFLVIASGGLACALSGLVAQRYGAKRIATGSLFLSGLCCLASPLFLSTENALVFCVFLFFWGLVVIADSPLFSTLVAQHAPEESRGSALTIVNCIGFAITIISIQCIGYLSTKLNPQYLYMFLSIGPILGLISLWSSTTEKAILVNGKSKI
jgi:MFS family permease